MNVPKGVSAAQWASCFSSGIQEVIILPTEHCNFRCTYCYEDFKIGRMPDRVQRGIENLLSMRAPKLHLLRFSWFGGEPLLAWDIILRLSRHAFSLSQQHGFRLSGGLTTNGYLLSKDLAAELISLKQDRFQISIDGWQEGHDQTRRMANGQTTFDSIWANLLTLRSLQEQFEVALRLHLTSSNTASMKELCIALAREFGSDSRFSMNFQDVRDLGGTGGPRVIPQTTQEVRKQVDYLTRVLIANNHDTTERISNNFDTVGESAGSRSADDIRREETYICYASKPNSILIRANGRLGKCTVMFDNPANDIGEILEDGTLAIDNPRLRRWFHGLESMDLDALACPAMALRNVDNLLDAPGNFPIQIRAVNQ
jgi:uncharacterized protein